ncbi:MAG: TRAP transporter substrate-binding protein DctP [Myxococcota bacterium]
MSSIIKPTRRSFVKTTAAASAATVFGVPLLAKAEPKFKIKIATLAPEGSSWHKAFKRVARLVKEKTDGEVIMKLYPNGVMGDEGAMVRKMRTGQLDGAACTSVGLGEINKQLLMLQLPLLFKNEKELDRVRLAMSDKFKQLLLDGGFVLNGWGDVGRIFLFSNTPIKVPSDAARTKMWVWDTDPVSKEVMKVAGVNAIPLGVPDVLPSLQTKVIDAFGAAPYAAIALQWYSKAAYVTNLSLSMGIGGSVLTEKTYNKLSPYHEAMKEISEATYTSLLKRIRKDNKKSMKTLTEKGIQVVQPENMPKWIAMAEQVRKNLTGPVFKESLIDEMMGHLGR